MQTIGDFYRYAVTQMVKCNAFFGHGTEDVLAEAWWLICGALKLPPDLPRAEFMPCRLNKEENLLLQGFIQKRAVAKIPTAYLLKEAYQSRYKFFVDERVLIPRSPIAELLENELQPWTDAQGVSKILDLCTGSGCLAILAAYAFPESQVDAVDLSKDALEVAQKNIAIHHMKNQVHLLESDVFSALEGRLYDVIITNPPYVNAEDFREMPAEYCHEPSIALAAGEDGLSIVHKILAGAKSHLQPGGILILEVGNSAPALLKAYPRLPFITLEFEHGGEGVFLLNEHDL